MPNLNLSGAPQKIAILGNYLPRQCGIATFTTDLAQAIAGDEGELTVDVVAMVEELGTPYPARVKLQVLASERAAYELAAEFLNRQGYEVLSVQHEYGIFGGEAGEYLLDMLRSVKMPIVTTMHTVIQAPTPAQRTVTEGLIQLSERVVVMSEAAIKILIAEYGLTRDNIDFIPHGIPDFSKAGRSNIKKSLGIDGPMILTFGLLSPDKGIQYVVGAMPKILAQSPESTYVVLGATHPNIRAHEGESYRQGLVDLSRRLGVEERVKFVDRFVSQDELVEYLVEADIYITPYLNPNQITSGTLAYALGAGKAVISTPYLYAEELLSDGSGHLVPFRDSNAIADMVVSHNCCPGNASHSKSATFGHQLQWPAIGRRYVAAFAHSIRQSAARLKELSRFQNIQCSEFGLPAFSPKHLSTLTDDTGIFQHAVRTLPNRAHGYCVDDTARALLLTVMLEQGGELSPRLAQMQNCYLSFVHDSLNQATGRFRNFLSFNREWLEDQGSDDSHARTLWALGAVVHRSTKPSHRAVAVELFQKGIAPVYAMRSPRAWAYSVLAADEYLGCYPNDCHAQALMAQMSGRLLREYRLCHTPDWLWFEDVVSYANARLCQAMILAGQRISDSDMLSCGIESLKWLMGHQETKSGDFRPIGSEGHFKRGNLPAAYDQQPIEAWVSISACISAGEATGSEAWMTKARRTFSWFLGRNDLQLPVYDRGTGGCRDGLHSDRMNENQGAESTISFLCALAEMKAALGKTTAFGPTQVHA